MTPAELEIDPVTRLWFSRQYRGLPRVAPGHIPTITHDRRRSGLTLACSCGRRLHRSSGCNTPGLSYAALACYELYSEHLAAYAARKDTP